MEEESVPFFATPPIEKPVINRDAFVIHEDNRAFLFRRQSPYPMIRIPEEVPKNLVAKLATQKYEIAFLLFVWGAGFSTGLLRDPGLLISSGVATSMLAICMGYLLIFRGVGKFLRYLFIGSMPKLKLVALNTVEGQLIQGQVIDAQKIRGGRLYSSTYLAITYAFYTLTGDYRQAHIHHPIMRLSLTKPPKPETPVYIWYDVKGRHYLL